MKNLFPLVCLAALILPAAAQERIVFPNDPAVLNIRDAGAKGDGKTDDTAAIQRAIRSIRETEWTRVLYFPNGTYLVTEPLRFDHLGDDEKRLMRTGPWLYGETRNGVVLKVPDGTPLYADPTKPTEVVRAHPSPDGARTSADWFDRTMVNFTIDCGDNPGAIGLKFYSNNTGLLRGVTVRGNGVVGLDLGFIDQNGPLLVQDVLIDGFGTGVRAGRAINSQTLSNIVHACSATAS